MENCSDRSSAQEHITPLGHHHRLERADMRARGRLSWFQWLQLFRRPGLMGNGYWVCLLSGKYGAHNATNFLFASPAASLASDVGK